MTARFSKAFILGATLLTAGVASAEAPFIAQFEAHDDMYGGALWRNDNPNNNNQRGAGAEHQKVVRVGDNILVLATASYTNVTPMIPGAGFSSADAGILPPTDAGPDGIGAQATGTRVQGLCTSYRIDAQMGLVKTNMSYFTQNNSPDWQNAHKMSGTAIDGGQAAVVTYGFDPNGNRTRIYARVLGPNCELLSPQQQQFADNNDDYGGSFVGGSVSDGPGIDRVFGTFIGNGNGNDDGHAYGIKVAKTGTGGNTYTVTPYFNATIENNEERTRAEIYPTKFPNKAIACWAAGNNQPPDKGLRCGMINTAEGVPDGDRLEWRQYIVQRDGNIMYSTATLAPITDQTGALTDKYILSYVKVDVSNRQGRAKGQTQIQTVPVQISETGITMLDAPKSGLFGLSDGAHPGMTAGTYGVDKRPVAFLWSGSITDGGLATVKIVGMNTEGRLEPIRALNWADHVSGGHNSLWYGHNPNTPQGRSYPVSTMLIDNPGFGQPGGYQPEVKQFLVAANVHRKDHTGGCASPPDPNKGSNNGACGGKNALSVSLIPVAAEKAVTPPTGQDDPTPVDPTDPTGTTTNDIPELGGGCSTSSPNGLGAMMALGLGAMLIRRRRRS